MGNLRQLTIRKSSVLLTLTLLNALQSRGQFSGTGSGTELDPYVITTATQLDEVRNDLTAHYELANDIDLTFDTSDPSGAFYNSGAGWEPIGLFQGTFDGGGFTLSGLVIDRPGETGVGLFGQLSDVTIQNLILSNITIEGLSNVGGLAGSVVGFSSPAGQSHFSQIGVEGQVSAEGGGVGGIFGSLGHSDLEKSYMNGTVRSTGMTSTGTGGIAGYLTSTGELDLGIIDSYAIADVSGDQAVGGIAGSANASAITNVYYTGFLTTNETNFSGIRGTSSFTPTVDSYWDGEVTCIISGSSSTASMRTQALYENWDFGSIWSITEGDLPYLQWQGALPDFLSPVFAFAIIPDLEEETAYCQIEYPSPSPVVEAPCDTEVSGIPSVSFPITAIGTTTVTWTFEDVFGNVYTVDQDFTIQTDNVPPVPDLVSLSDVTAECSATPDTPTATDQCSGSVGGTSNVTFPITAQGTTEVTWTYTDDEGNSSTQTQNVILDDTTDPVPDQEELTDISATCQVDAITAPTATDNCDGQIDGVSDTDFPIIDQGTTTITWTYTDAAGNLATQQQNVILTDDTAPVADLETLSTIYTTCEGVVENVTAPTATDNCEGQITGTTSQTFPFSPSADTQILWEYEDGNGNTALQYQDVLIAETDEVIVEESLCEASDFTFPDGTPWTGETTQTSALTNEQGCDSLVTTNVTILPAPAVDLGEDQVEACQDEALTFSIDESSINFDTYTISTLFGNSSTDQALTFSFDQNFIATLASQDVFVTIELTDTNGCTGTDQAQLIDNSMTNWGIGFVQNDDPDISMSGTTLPETADSFEWDFGDGNTNSTEENPSHTYTENGSYDITLTVTNECGSESLSTTTSITTITALSLDESTPLKLYPNPATDFIFLSYNKTLSASLYRLDGKKVKESVIHPKEALDISSLTEGQYILQLSDGQRLLDTEIILKKTN